MAEYDYRKLIMTHFENFNLHDTSKIGPMVADDVKVVNIPFSKNYTGKNGYVEFAKSWFETFPDLRIDVKNVYFGDEWAVAEFIATGTQGAPLKTPLGDIPSLGRKGTLPCVELFRFREGKIVEMRLYYDAVTLLMQAGVLRSDMIATSLKKEIAQQPSVM